LVLMGALPHQPSSLNPPEASMNYVTVLAIVLAATINAMPQPSSDEIAIRNIIQEEITAWNAGDAAAYSRHFSEDGTFTNIRGQFFTGRQAFIDRHDRTRPHDVPNLPAFWNRAHPIQH
jgi:hypothetical protein